VPQASSSVAVIPLCLVFFAIGGFAAQHRTQAEKQSYSGQSPDGYGDDQFAGGHGCTPGESNDLPDITDFRLLIFEPGQIDRFRGKLLQDFVGQRKDPGTEL